MPFRTPAWVLALLLLVHQAQTALPATPAGKQLEKTIAAIAAESGAEVEAFIGTFAASLRASMPAQQLLKKFEQMHDEYGDVSVEAIEASEPYAVSAVLRSKRSGTRLRARLTTEPSPPNAIKTLDFEPLAKSSTAGASLLEDARSMFAAGRFDRARQAYERLLTTDPHNSEAATGLGRLELMANNFVAAEKHLRRAIELSGSREARNLLGEALYRQDKFEESARWFKESGDEAIAKQLQLFSGRPYRIEGTAPETSLRFVATDPLPVVQIRINDSEPLDFVVDTGGAQLALSAELAARLHVEGVASETGTFAGGQQREVSHGKVNSVTLGDFVVRDVPVGIGTPGITLAGRKIEGVIGTVLLYHFLPTIDYPGGRLVLRRRGSAGGNARAGQSITIPFWMDGDHFMVAWGRVNQANPMLLFVDTGFAGGGFLGPDSTLKEAGITLEDPPQPGTRQRFSVSTLALGDAVQKNIRGIVGAFPPRMEQSHGFRIGGLISHQFFRPYAVTFDFEQMQISLQTQGTAPAGR